MENHNKNKNLNKENSKKEWPKKIKEDINLLDNCLCLAGNCSCLN